MTLPDERYRAIKQTREFLWQLADPRATRGIPAAIRNQARGLLRHYPNDWDMNRAAEAAPDVFQQQMEPLTRLMAQYTESKNHPE